MPASSQSPILNVVNSSRQSTANLALVSFEFRTTSMQTRKILEQSWLVSLHRCIPNFLSSTLRTDRCVLSQTALPPLFILRVSISHRVAGSTLERILDSSLSSLPCTPRSFVCHSLIISASIPLADSRCSARTDVWESGSVDERAVYLLCGNADFQVSPWRGQYEFRSELILIHRFAARRTLVVNRSQNQNSPRTENFDRNENPPSTMASFLQEEDG